jgi:hypothetical protein
VTGAAALEALPPGRPYLLTARPGPDLAAAGWTEEELVATGVATRYRALTEPADGRCELAPDGTAPYRTRVVVRRPARAAPGGTLVVEWLNVTGGGDACPDWTYLADELVRRGVAWAGVSAQLTGVADLAGRVPERYAGLAHPGDGFAFDVYEQVARAVAGLTRAGTVLAVGESQSAAALTTYVNGVHPLTGAFAGYLVHSRPGAALPVGAGGAVALEELRARPAVRLRDDASVPVLVVQTEGDLFEPLAWLGARQPDTPLRRTWEVAGNAHADRYLLGDAEALLGLPAPVNTGQQVFVLRAALRHLERWARGGEPPPAAPGPLAVADGAFVRDGYGNVLGGVRTPAVDAPAETLSGLPMPGAPPLLALFGTTTPLTGAWPDRDSYLAAYRAAVDATIAAGFAVPEDRDALLADSREHRIV